MVTARPALPFASLHSCCKERPSRAAVPDLLYAVQAMSRAHRIGQSQTVNIYRSVSFAPRGILQPLDSPVNLQKSYITPLWRAHQSHHRQVCRTCRLLTSNTVEEDILERAKQKMGA
jgi:hypothetical protein